MPGTDTLAPEVTHVSKHGFWLLLADEELLVPVDQFPWFRKGTIEQISEVQWPTADHLYWPALVIDLSVQSLRNPSAFPPVTGNAFRDDDFSHEQVFGHLQQEPFSAWEAAEYLEVSMPTLRR